MSNYDATTWTGSGRIAPVIDPGRMSAAFDSLATVIQAANPTARLPASATEPGTFTPACRAAQIARGVTVGGSAAAGPLIAANGPR